MPSRLGQFGGAIKKFIYKSFTRLVLSVYAIFSLILLLLLFIVLISLYSSLRDTTSEEIRSTLSKQADDNMLALSTQGSAALWQNFFQIRELLRLTGEVVVSMQNEATFALANTQSVTVAESCRTLPCTERFAYQTHSNSFSQDWVDRTSRLEPVVKLIVQNTLVPNGLTVHFLNWGFSRYMPAELGIGANNTAEETWLNEWQSRKAINGTLVSTMVSSIDFSLTPAHSALMQELVLEGKSVGVMCARLELQYYLSQATQDMLYHGKGFILIIYTNGVAVRENLVQTSVKELGIEEEWAEMLADPYVYSNTTHKVDYQGELYRMALHPLGESLKEANDNWWFAVALLVKEADILDLDSYDYNTEMALWMVVYPMVAAILILSLGAVLNWFLNNQKLRTPMNRITEAMNAMKEGDPDKARAILRELAKHLHKSEVQRLVLGMFRLINEVSERNSELSNGEGMEKSEASEDRRING